MPNITPCLWFDTQAEDAAAFYTSVFPNSRITEVTHYGEAGPRPAGMAMTVSFELDGRELLALNGGPDFTFNEAISLTIDCRDQDEVDHYWSALGEGGEPGPCGWLKDRFGLSWQIVPARLEELIRDPDTGRAQRAMRAMLQMSKIDIAEIERAADSVTAG
jgi:predicted 3-demethylubiquinone-9 3-methyltransferase (glyoxalase superfamily)